MNLQEIASFLTKTLHSYKSPHYTEIGGYNQQRDKKVQNRCQWFALYLQPSEHTQKSLQRKQQVCHYEWTAALHNGG